MTGSSVKRRPEVGDVIVYGFLWSHEADAGREDPINERPCVVVVAVGEGDQPTILVAPITSQKPDDPDAIELSARAVDLDRPSWIVPWEVNAFRWIGPDVGRAVNPKGAWWRLGRLAPEVQALLIERMRAAGRRRQARLIRRSE